MRYNPDERYHSIFRLAPVSLWEEDYTEVARRLEELKAQGVEDFREYFTSHPEVAAELATTLKILDVNDISLELFGAESKEQLLGNVDKVFIAETYQIWIDELVSMARGEPYFACEGIARTFDGRILNLHITITKLPAQEGMVRGLLCLLDITRRKQAELALAEQEKLYRTLIESIPHMIWMGDARGKITYCNNAMAEMTGTPLDRASGRDWLDAIRPDERDKILDIQRVAHQDGRPYRGEYVFRAADGARRSVYFIDTPVKDSSGDIVNWVGVNTDVTELKQAQDELQLALNRSNTELAQIAHAASHDLQEPLRMVTSYAQLLQQRYTDDLDERANKYIGYMIEGSKRIRQLILDLLALANVSMESEEFTLVDSNKVVDRAIDSMAEDIFHSRAEITRESLPTVRGSAAQLGQLFQCLFENSIKFRGDAQPRIHVSARREGAMWRYAVKDNGIGFDSGEYGARVFEMFQRLHTRDQYPGTGIGLTLAKKIIEWHRGRMWAESEPGVGTTIFFLLPGIDMEVLDSSEKPGQAAE